MTEKEMDMIVEKTEVVIRAVVKEETSEIRKDISSLKEDVSVLKEDVSVLKEDVSELKMKAKEHDKRFDRQDEQIKKINITLSSIKAMTYEIHEYTHGALRLEVDDIRSRVEVLENKVAIA